MKSPDKLGDSADALREHAMMTVVLRRSSTRAMRLRSALDDTLVVEAAAGTGKTTELVKRIVRILGDRPRERSSSIVAVTFTEKAAGELKLRLREALERERARCARTSTRGSGSTRRWRASRKRTSAPFTGSAPSCCASGRSKRASIRCSRVLTEAQAERLFDEAFGGWLQAQLTDPPEGVRRALRRSTPVSFSAGTAAAGRPDRSPAARGVGAAAVARLRRAVDAAAVRSRRATSTGSLASCTRSRR